MQHVTLKPTPSLHKCFRLGVTYSVKGNLNEECLRKHKRDVYATAVQQGWMTRVWPLFRLFPSRHQKNLESLPSRLVKSRSSYLMTPLKH